MVKAVSYLYTYKTQKDNNIPVRYILVFLP